MNELFKTFIGLEIHVELRTLSKMFCGCINNHFGVAPNTHTCPVCLGLPGALPYPNKRAIEWTALIGLALNCKINKNSKFDRKHYFYPDLPKGYQISQYDEPLASSGWLQMSNVKLQITNKIKIRRVHLEEDTGKLVHKKVNSENVTLVDFNRSGVPLVEIVTEPDIKTPAEAKEFAQKLQKIIRFLGVSDCDMEKGSMRLEANISLAPYTVHSPSRRPLRAGGRSQITKLPDYKVEIKNINSFRFLEKAINYEIKRQSDLLSQGKTPNQETRGWSEAKNATVPQRFKETEADYRYFPEPDIPPIVFTNEEIKQFRNSIPLMPDEIEKRFRNIYKLPVHYIEVLTENKGLAIFAENALKIAKKKGLPLDKLAGEIVNKPIDFTKVSVDAFIKKFKEKGSNIITSSSELEIWITKSIEDTPNAVADYKKGKTQAISAIIGNVMKLSKGKADPSVVRKLLEEKLR